MTQNLLCCWINETETAQYSDINNSHQCDPFHNLSDDITEPKYNRVERVVFADPLQIRTNETACPKIQIEEDNVTIDNVTVTKRKGRRKKYSMNLDNSNLVCPQQKCQKTFTSLILLKAHVRKVHCSEKDFVCEKCGAGFTAQYLLNRHSAVHEGNKIQCPVCKKMLSKRTNLTLHLRSHSDTRPHECTSCHKRFLRRSTLKVHINFVHKENIEK